MAGYGGTPSRCSPPTRERTEARAVRERDRGVWQERNWAETFAEVMALAAALEALGSVPARALP